MIPKTHSFSHGHFAQCLTDQPSSSEKTSRPVFCLFLPSAIFFLDVSLSLSLTYILFLSKGSNSRKPHSSRELVTFYNQCWVRTEVKSCRRASELEHIIKATADRAHPTSIRSAPSRTVKCVQQANCQIPSMSATIERLASP